MSESDRKCQKVTKDDTHGGQWSREREETRRRAKNEVEGGERFPRIS